MIFKWISINRISKKKVSKDKEDKYLIIFLDITVLLLKINANRRIGYKE